MRRAKKAAPRKAVARKAVGPEGGRANARSAPKRVAAPRPKARARAGSNRTRTQSRATRRSRRRHRPDAAVLARLRSLGIRRALGPTRAARRYAEHTETSPALTGGDVDADWESAYSVGDEAPGGDNPTPDQDLVDDIGRAVGVEYQDNEELKGEAKIAKRDQNRWELDPASSDDWDER